MVTQEVISLSTNNGKSGDLTHVNDMIEITGVKLLQFNHATQQKWSGEQKRKKLSGRK